MKYILEFGNRGGIYTDNIVIPSRKLAAKLASDMVEVFRNNATSEGVADGTHDWRKIGASMPRVTWQSSSHFVSLSVLDGVARGPAAATLWRTQP